MIERSRVRIPAGAAGEFSSPGSTFCTDSYFGIRPTPRVTAVARKNPCHSAKSAGGKLPLNFTYVTLHEVTWCMVVWCTQNLRRDGSSVMWHQPCQRCKCTTSVDIQKRTIKSYSLM